MNRGQKILANRRVSETPVINVSYETKCRLHKLAKPGQADTFEDIIIRLLECSERYEELIDENRIRLQQMGTTNRLIDNNTLTMNALRSIGFRTTSNEDEE